MSTIKEKDNHGTREACQRLVDAGIVLETDFYWRGSQSFGETKPHFELMDKYRAESFKKSDQPEISAIYLPAVSMAEAFRELPESIQWHSSSHHLTIEKLGDETSAYYRTNGCVFENTNPADALIDLLIWVKKPKETEKEHQGGRYGFLGD